MTSSSSSRFIPNRNPDYAGIPDASQAQQVQLELGRILDDVILPKLQEGLASGLHSRSTCYTGTAGVAHALWHLHTVLQANPRVALPGGSAVVLAAGVVSTMVQLADQALGEAAKGMHPSRRVSLLDGAAGVYMTGALVHSAAAQAAAAAAARTPGLAVPHATPPAGPEMQAPSLQQQRMQQQGPPPGLLSAEQHWARCRECCQAFDGCAQHALMSDSDEVLYGRAGYMLGALTLQAQLCKAANQGACALCALPQEEVARQVALAMLDSGRRGATQVRGDPQPPLYYEWHASPYLGAAHGLMGILYAMLHCQPLLEDPMAVIDIKAGLRYVLAHEQDVPGSQPGSGGHYPTQMGQFKPNSERVLVHWCHGAPGAVFLFCKAHEVLGGGGEEAAYLPAACRAGEVVWARGLLRKGPGLCHGVSGNGFALHRLWKAGAGAKWLHRTQQFGLALGDQEVRHTFNNPDNPYSLFQGCAAAVGFLADVITCTSAQHHHLASGPDAGPLKPISAPLMLGFPLYEP